MHLTHPKYTYKKGNIYYFSKAVPADLQHHYRKNRLVCSLRTKSFHEAKFRSQSMKLELEKQWLSLRVKQDSQIFTDLLNKTHASTCIRLKEALEYYLKIKGDGKTKHMACSNIIVSRVSCVGDRPSKAKNLFG